LQVFVRDNNVDQALRILKKKMQREGVFREMRRRRFYEKPSEVRAREKSEAIRRARNLARKRAQREGLITDPQEKAAGGEAARAATRDGRSHATSAPTMRHSKIFAVRPCTLSLTKASVSPAAQLAGSFTSA
jgi:small subunit ribosomal protein S21